MPTEHDHEEEVLYAETADALGPSLGAVIVELIAVRCESFNFNRTYLMYSYAHSGHNENPPINHERRELLDVATDAAAQRIAIGLFDSLLSEMREVIAVEEQARPEDEENSDDSD